MAENNDLRRRTVNDVEVLLRVLKNLPPLGQHDAMMKAVLFKLSNGETAAITDTNDLASNIMNKSRRLSKQALADLLDMVTGHKFKMNGQLAFQCLIAAVGNGYINNPSPLINLVEISIEHNQLAITPKDLFALLANLLKFYPDLTLSHISNWISILFTWMGILGKKEMKKLLFDCWTSIFNGLLAVKNISKPSRFYFLSNSVFTEMKLFVENTSLDKSIPVIVWQAYDKLIAELKEPFILASETVSAWLASVRTVVPAENAPLTPRRGILRNSKAQSPNGQTKPNDSDHDEIIVPHHSPASTPSAGILKRRRHLFTEQGEGNDDQQSKMSPSSNQRRVHFCTTELEYLSDDDGEQARHSPRKRFRTAQGPVAVAMRQASVVSEPSFLNRFQTRTIRMVQQVANNSPGTTSTSPVTAIGTSPITIAAPSPNIPHQLYLADNQKPIYPSLIDCTETIEAVMPQLVPPSKIRAMVMFFKGRRITTIGRLASQTEYQALQLPLKTPKLETIRTALQGFEDGVTAKDGDASAIEEPLLRSDIATTVISPARPDEQAQQPQQEGNVQENDSIDSEGDLSGNEELQAQMNIVPTVISPTKQRQQGEPIISPSRAMEKQCMENTPLTPADSNDTSTNSTEYQPDQSVSPIFVIISPPTGPNGMQNAGNDDSSRSLSPIILFENITPRNTPVKPVSSSSMVSPVLISKDVICQTEKRNPRMLALELLQSLSSEVVDEMSAQDIRKVGNDLMDCLKIILNRPQ